SEAASKEKESGKEETAPKKEEAAKKPVEVKIDFSDLDARVQDVPVPPGNYSSLQATAKRLCWLNAPDDHPDGGSQLQCLAIDNKGDKPDTVISGASSY